MRRRRAISEWVVKRRTARAWVAAATGDLRAGVEEARAAVTAIEGSGLILVNADVTRCWPVCSPSPGRTSAAAEAAARAAALYEAKGNVVAARAMAQASKAR